MQLAVYAHSTLYDPETGTRSPLGPINLDRGLIISLSADTGLCELIWVDIAAGWEAVQLATQVRAWRARDDLSEAYVAAPAPIVCLMDQIAACVSRDQILDLWEAAADDWTDIHTVAAKSRLAVIEGALA